MHCEKEINEESLLTEVSFHHQFINSLQTFLGRTTPSLAISVALSSASCSTLTCWVCAEGKSASSSLNGEFGTFQTPEKHTYTCISYVTM